MFKKNILLLIIVFLPFMGAYTLPLRYVDSGESPPITHTQTVKLLGTESFLYRVSKEPSGAIRVERANDLTHVVLNQNRWEEAINLVTKKMTGVVDNTPMTGLTSSQAMSLDQEIQSCIAKENTTDHLTVLMLEPEADHTISHAYRFDLKKLLIEKNSEFISLSMLLAQTDEQKNFIEKTSKDAGLSPTVCWHEAKFTTQRAWTRHHFEITGGLYMTGFFFADIFMKKAFSWNPYAATALYGSAMTYQLCHHHRWGDLKQSLTALGALGALSFSRYHGLLPI